MWSMNGEDEDDVKKKLEELAWVATLLFGVSGYQEISKCFLLVYYRILAHVSYTVN